MTQLELAIPAPKAQLPIVCPLVPLPSALHLAPTQLCICPHHSLQNLALRDFIAHITGVPCPH